MRKIFCVAAGKAGGGRRARNVPLYLATGFDADRVAALPPTLIDVFDLRVFLSTMRLKRSAIRPAFETTAGAPMSNDRDDSSSPSVNRRRLIQGIASLPVAAVPGWAMAQPYPTAKVNTTKLAITDTEVTVGQLHSATGTMAISETGSIQAEQLAIDQINAMGGILGRKIKVIKEDGASDWPTFAEKSKKLLVNDKVAAVFGCWTSASRKAVLPVFEGESGVLYCPG
eukprot:gene515-724_t